jgi:hypothetical protein
VFAQPGDYFVVTLNLLLRLARRWSIDYSKNRNRPIDAQEAKMKLNNVIRLGLLSVIAVAFTGAGADAGKTIVVKGYVLDSACAFTKGLKKPISAECATACAKAGSPLVILTDSGKIYWPIADTTPATGQNDKLLPYAGQKVTASGKVFERAGSTALVIEKIEPVGSQN